MTHKRILVVATVLLAGYLAIAFGKPYYQYAMMYQAFDDAVDAAMVRIQVVKSHAGADVTGEVLQAVGAFLEKRAQDLGVPLDPHGVEIRILSGSVVVKVGWISPVELPHRTVPLSFSLEKERKLPAR